MRFTDRPFVARGLARSGLLAALDTLPRRRGLLVFNYHRVGVEDRRLDSGTVSASLADFRAHVAYVARHFATPPLPEILRCLEARRFDAPYALFTFDDGYRDNYQHAFPALREAGVPGAFFVVTDYVDRPSLPWWDRTAYMVQASTATRLRLSYPVPLDIEMPAAGRRAVVRRVLRGVKDARPFDERRFFDELAAATGVVVPSGLASGLFMSWQELREMRNAGMAIGSHTRTHRVLAALPEAEQLEELTASRDRLAGMLGEPPEVLSYPVGGPTAFSAATRRLARESGYRAAFSFFGGMNDSRRLDPFALSRVPVEKEQGITGFRLQAAVESRLWRRG